MNKKTLLTIGTAFTLLIGSNAHAWQHSKSSTITSMTAYSQAIDGDILISLGANNTSECSHGYYVNKKRPGYESMVSLLLAAYHSNSTVVISADTSLPKWTGSKNSYCLMHAVRYQR